MIYEFSHPNGHTVKLWIEEDGALSLARDGVWETRLYVGTLFEKVVPSQPDYLWTFIEALEILTRRYVRKIAPPVLTGGTPSQAEYEQMIKADPPFQDEGAAICNCGDCKNRQRGK